MNIARTLYLINLVTEVNYQPIEDLLYIHDVKDKYRYGIIDKANGSIVLNKSFKRYLSEHCPDY